MVEQWVNYAIVSVIAQVHEKYKFIVVNKV